MVRRGVGQRVRDLLEVGPGGGAPAEQFLDRRLVVLDRREHAPQRRDVLQRDLVLAGDAQGGEDLLRAYAPGAESGMALLRRSERVCTSP